MSDNQKFCIQCGCYLPDNAQFCPQCGNVVEGTDAQAQQAQMKDQFEKMVVEGRRSFLAFALAVYVFPAVIFGLLAIIDASHSADMIWHNADFQQAYHSHGWKFSEGDLQTFITVIGAMELISGLCAGATMYFVQKGEKRKIATICCAVAAVLCVWSVFGTLMGLIMTFNVYAEKAIFHDEN